MANRNFQKDRAVLDFIQKHAAEHGYPTTIREIAKALGYKHPSVLYARLSRLRGEGHLAWENNLGRTIRVTVPEGTAKE